MVRTAEKNGKEFSLVDPEAKIITGFENKTPQYGMGRCLPSAGDDPISPILNSLFLTGTCRKVCLEWHIILREEYIRTYTWISCSYVGLTGSDISSGLVRAFVCSLHATVDFFLPRSKNMQVRLIEDFKLMQ